MTVFMKYSTLSSVQAQAEAAPELLICDIDLSETDAVRAQIPVLRARRTDLYQLKYEKDS